MKKLRLEDLAVDTFATTSGAAFGRGTVRAHATEYTCAVSEIHTCACPTRQGCVYPSTSCGDTVTYGEATCFCEYPNTDVRVCCSDAGCTGAGGMC